jgi:NAD(P)-dependent dehydrogenase (short-subunit alcohol dehydrogenase family)
MTVASLSELLASEREEYAIWCEFTSKYSTRHAQKRSISQLSEEELRVIAKVLPYSWLARCKNVSPDQLLAAAVRDTARFRQTGDRSFLHADGLLPMDHWTSLHPSTTIARPATQRCYMCALSFVQGTNLGGWKTSDGGHAALCFECGCLNRKFVDNRSDFSGLHVVVTGCRHTVGLATVVQLLRQGATVLGTTRFPRAAMLTLRSLPDFEEWKSRISIVECDFLNAQHVSHLRRILENGGFDIFISNAFLTVHQTPAYYAKLAALDRPRTPGLVADGTMAIGGSECVEPRLIHGEMLVEAGEALELNEHNNLDENREAGDKTMWMQKLGDYEQDHILETNVVNQIVPTMLFQSALKGMQRTKEEKTMMINVSSTEHLHASDEHALTGMQKAAMENLIERLQYMENDEAPVTYTCSVDPGFVTGVRSEGRKPLLDEDAAARVLQPVQLFADGRIEVFKRISVWKDFGPFKARGYSTYAHWLRKEGQLFRSFIDLDKL